MVHHSKIIRAFLRWDRGSDFFLPRGPMPGSVVTQELVRFPFLWYNSPCYFGVIDGVFPSRPRGKWGWCMPCEKFYRIRVWESDCKLEVSSRIHILYVAQGPAAWGWRASPPTWGKGRCSSSTSGRRHWPGWPPAVFWLIFLWIISPCAAPAGCRRCASRWAAVTPRATGTGS